MISIAIISAAAAFVNRASVHTTREARVFIHFKGHKKTPERLKGAPDVSNSDFLGM